MKPISTRTKILLTLVFTAILGISFIYAGIVMKGFTSPGPPEPGDPIGVPGQELITGQKLAIKKSSEPTKAYILGNYLGPFNLNVNATGVSEGNCAGKNNCLYTGVLVSPDQNYIQAGLYKGNPVVLIPTASAGGLLNGWTALKYRGTGACDPIANDNTRCFDLLSWSVGAGTIEFLIINYVENITKVVPTMGE